MRSYWKILCLVFVLVGICSGAVLAAVGVGDKVKAFTLDKRGGGSYRIPQDFQGKVVFLNVWASWCEACRVEMPELVKVKEKFKDQPFVILEVNVDKKREAADKFLKKMGLDLPVVYDTDQRLIEYFAPVGIPASYIIGPSGKVEKQYLGFDKSYIEKYITDIGDLVKKVRDEPAAGKEKDGTTKP